MNGPHAGLPGGSIRGARWAVVLLDSPDTPPHRGRPAMNSRNSRPPAWVSWLSAGFLAWTCLEAQQPPRFALIQPLTNREIRLELNAALGPRYRIEAAISPASWTPLVTLAGAASLPHTDSAAPFLPQRFYRALELAETNLLTGDHLVTSAGDVVIHPVYHAALVLGWAGKAIYVDPGDLASRFTGLPRADLILLTHEHSDHYVAATLNTVKGTNALILAPQAV